MAPQSRQNASDRDGQELFAQLSKTWLWADVLQLRRFLRAHSKNKLWKSYSKVVRLCESKSSHHSSQNSMGSASIFSGSADSRSDVTSSDSSDVPGVQKQDMRTSCINQSESTAYASSALQPTAQSQNSSHTAVPSNIAPLDASPPAVSPPANQPVSCVCIMCCLRYSSQTTLSKHRREECESKGIWHCPCGKREKRKENMRDHIRDQTSSKCGNPCKSSDNNPCSTHRSEDSCVHATFQEHPTKKVWGCPVCGRCFITDRDWYQHEKVHYADIITQGRQIFVTGWNRSMLVRALLNSNFLRSAATEYNWGLCRWDNHDVIGDSEFKKLIFALERHHLAPQIKTDGLYARLPYKKALVAYAFYMGCYGAPFPAVDDPTTSAVDSLSGNRQVIATATPKCAKETSVGQGNITNYYQFHGAPREEAHLDSSSHAKEGSEPVSSLTCVTKVMPSDLKRQTSENSLQRTQSSRLNGRCVIGRFANFWESTSSAQRIPEKIISEPSVDVQLATPTHLQHHMTNVPPLSIMSQTLPVGLQHDITNFYNQLSLPGMSQDSSIHAQGRLGSPLLDHTSQSTSLNAYIDPRRLERQRIPTLANVNASIYPSGASHVLNLLHNDKRDSSRMSWIASSIENQVPPGAPTTFVANNTFLGEPESSADGTRPPFNYRQFPSGHGQSPFGYQQT